MSSPSILASFLRGAGIILTAPQQADDGDRYEEQVVFQPENCQENLRILEALLTVLVKGNSYIYNIGTHYIDVGSASAERFSGSVKTLHS